MHRFSIYLDLDYMKYMENEISGHVHAFPLYLLMLTQTLIRVTLICH